LQQQRDRLNNKAAEGLWPVQSEAETMGRELLAAQVMDYGISDGQYVTNLYESFLQRGPDSGGLGFWTSIAAGGSSHRQNVLNAFATCGPFRDLAGAVYREVYWLVPDHLGTTRMVATRIGSLASVKRHDYLPFGEELGLVAGRMTAQGYSQVDNIRQRFTQKERDNETDLDWFGPGRYYSNRQGRFTSVDPGGAGARATNPQSLNRYAYTLNRPTVAIDPNGLSTIVITVTPQGANNPTATVQLYTKTGIVQGARYNGLAAGQHRDRQFVNGDTPYGVYRADQTTVTEGGNGLRLQRRFGTGKVRFDAIAGDANNVDVSRIRIHGGGSRLQQPYDLNQPLIATNGCVRVANGDVNALIQDISTLSNQNNNDSLDRVFVGTEDGLRAMENETDAAGNYVYADLRLSLGMYQGEAERNQLIEQERQRRAAHDNDANPQHNGRPRRPRPRNQGNHR